VVVSVVEITAVAEEDIIPAAETGIVIDIPGSK
jgi:hypothetical protein